MGCPWLPKKFPSRASASCAQKSGTSEELSRGACHNVNLSKQEECSGWMLHDVGMSGNHIAMDALLGSALLCSFTK